MNSLNTAATVEASGGLPPLAVSFKEACRLLGVGPSYMTKLIKESRIETLALGRRRLITYASLERLVGRAVPGKAVDLRIKQKPESAGSEPRAGT